MADDRVEKLERLNRMLDEGRLTEAEYATLKAEVIQEQPEPPSSKKAETSAVQRSEDWSRRSIVIAIIVVLVVIGIVWAVQENQALQAEYQRTIRDLADTLEGLEGG